ncbi:hypothetical protein [Lysinibacillus sp. Y5S-8]|uniref:hypothetical protein n=1 Tax=Lysinibacillus sp. Y5S-8 TaxID=3122488 RepID=UPI0030D15FAA
MDREQIERLKINSDCSYTYMRKLKKECLLGKTMIDEMNFIEEIAINHSVVELDYLEKGLTSSSENSLRFSKDFFSINISFYAILFSIIGVGFAGLYGYFNSISIKLIEAKIQNSEGIEEVNRLFDQVYTKGFKGLLWSSLFLLIGLFVLYFVRHITDSRRVTYLNYIRNANSFKERMLITNMESTDT